MFGVDPAVTRNLSVVEIQSYTTHKVVGDIVQNLTYVCVKPEIDKIGRIRFWKKLHGNSKYLLAVARFLSWVMTHKNRYFVESFGGQGW